MARNQTGESLFLFSNYLLVTLSAFYSVRKRDDLYNCRKLHSYFNFEYIRNYFSSQNGLRTISELASLHGKTKYVITFNRLTQFYLL